MGEPAGARVERLLDSWAESRLDDPLVWAMRPMLYTNFRQDGGSSAKRRLSALARSWATLPARGRGLGFWLQDDVLFALDGTNPNRVLRPIMAHRAQEGAAPRRIAAGMSTRTLHRLSRRALRHVDSLVRAAHGDEMAVDAAAAVRYGLAAARSVARAEAMLDRVPIHEVVVATQHNPNVRALLWCASRRGITSVYFPHAPVAWNRRYQDLPCDLAGLRGPAEVEFYESRGVTEGLTVVGNPAVPIATPSAVRVDRKLPVVLAVSPHPTNVLARIIDIVAAGSTAPVLVAPHPHSNLVELEGMIPATWRIWRDSSTFELLRQGPSAVIQHSSGVAWEALALGIPTIQIVVDDAPPSYPLIAPGQVLFASTGPELRSILTTAGEIADDPVSRERLVMWALRWCAQTGPNAVRSAARLVEDARSFRRTGKWLLDGWAPGRAT